MAELETELLTLVVAARLPPEEPISRWLSDRDSELRLRAGDHALVIEGCEYHVDRATGCVEVRDHRDPRAMRSQRYDPRRPGQPYLAPSIDDRHERWR
jgi:hypothetical protein